MQPIDKRNYNREKKFVVQNSPLTDIFEDDKTRNIYNVYVIVFTGIIIQTAVKQGVQHGRVDFGLETIRTGFAKFDRALLVWLCCLGPACASFFFFKVWSEFRNFDKRITTIWDWFWATSLLLYYFYSFKITTNAIIYFEFNPPCAVFVSIESVRILMKVHSFVRNSAPQVVSSPEPSLPDFSTFFYFLFAPTLIYRGSYPLSKNINWVFAAQRLLECLSVLLIYSFIMEAVYPSPERWLQKFTTAETVLLIIQYMPYGALILMSTFFLVFHSVQNFFAEITRFGDRLFYTDWWNACNFNTWLTKWNILVRDWLYYYIYCDFKKSVCDSTFLARLVVLLISFFVHEWIMFCWLGRFFPLMFLVAMVIVFPSFYFKLPDGVISNVIVWCAGSILISSMLVLCMFEYYAKDKAPLMDATLWELLVPRFLTSDCVLRR